MNVLGDTKLGYEAGELDAVLADGRVIGPFETPYSKDLFLRYYSKISPRLFTAEQLWSGAVEGEEYKLVLGDEVSLETHPFVEIFDVCINDDNGRVILDFDTKTRAVDPGRVILVSNPQIGVRQRKLPTPKPVPERFDTNRSEEKPIYTERSRFHGEIAVFHRSPNNEYIVGWRRSALQSQDIKGLSFHTNRDMAILTAKKLSKTFQPTEKQRKRRSPDLQKNRLYAWEGALFSKVKFYGDLDEIKSDSEKICQALNATSPEIVMGRSNTANSSYKANKITFHQDQMNDMTLVHELAHHFTDKIIRKLRHSEPDHGPAFAGVLTALYVKFLDADLNEALQKAKDMNVEIDHKYIEIIETILKKHAPEVKTFSP